ncbi:Gfo/Idh/MocA family protein [Limimaricola cinnabarinus]|uniref:Gfo/Idh/MocA family protein n=1 Tax=Limimaricola cinnabarinus TaxID=1125964 RepID=UPI00190F4911
MHRSSPLSTGRTRRRCSARAGYDRTGARRSSKHPDPCQPDRNAGPGVDAATITTPPQTRRALVLEAIKAGAHVIADKPFAPSVSVAAELTGAARARGVTLGVFHNRRWDTDVRTLKEVLDSGALGRVWRLHSRMDLDDPATLEPGLTGSLQRDIGSHLAIWSGGVGSCAS